MESRTCTSRSLEEGGTTRVEKPIFSSSFSKSMHLYMSSVILNSSELPYLFVDVFFLMYLSRILPVFWKMGLQNSQTEPISVLMILSFYLGNLRRPFNTCTSSSCLSNLVIFCCFVIYNVLFPSTILIFCRNVKILRKFYCRRVFFSRIVKILRKLYCRGGHCVRWVWERGRGGGNRGHGNMAAPHWIGNGSRYDVTGTGLVDFEKREQAGRKGGGT
jgi:hypothetical protein